MSQTATIRSLPQAFRIIKEMRMQGDEWGEDYRGAGREVVARVLEERMDEAIDRHLEEVAMRGSADRRNGVYTRSLLTSSAASSFACRARASLTRSRWCRRMPAARGALPWTTGTNPEHRVVPFYAATPVPFCSAVDRFKGDFRTADLSRFRTTDTRP